MLLKAARLLLSRPFSTLPTSLKWRSELQRRHLAAQISSLLLHRKNWITLLLRSKPTPLLRRHPSPDLILRILHKTHSHPDISLRFFRFAQSTLAFQPDLRSLCKMAQILIESNLLAPAYPLLAPALRTSPAAAVVESMLQAAATSSGKDSRSRLLSFLLESYSDLRLIDKSLLTLKIIRDLGCQPSTSSCNALLDALCSSNEIGTAWCSYAAVLRTGTPPDSLSWSLLARLLCSDGKLERAAQLLSSGFCDIACYDLVVDCYCQRGNFGAAIQLLDEMPERNLKPWFGTYSSILDGGCKFGDDGVVDSALRRMIATGLLRTVPFLDYNWVIKRLCELNKMYAAEMFFERARDENFHLRNGSYNYMLMAFSKAGRVDEAMKVYRIVLREGVDVSRSYCYDVFFAGICKGEPSCEADRVLRDSMGRGILPTVADLSKYIAAQCSRGWWVEASDLLNVALEKGVVLTEALCCCSLMEHYCATGLLDSAVSLHDKLKRLGGCLDANSYNSLLKALVAERRIEEAVGVFDYMRARNVMDSGGFVIMIGALCHEKDLRKAMKFHDEMLKLGLKPDDATYKHLIFGFV